VQGRVWGLGSGQRRYSFFLFLSLSIERSRFFFTDLEKKQKTKRRRVAANRRRTWKVGTRVSRVTRAVGVAGVRCSEVDVSRYRSRNSQHKPFPPITTENTTLLSLD
jgi:hypothetical protein